MTKPKLTIERLIAAAQHFCEAESGTGHEKLYGVSDGKSIGTYIEHKFKAYLEERYVVTLGSSASGIDLPSEDIQTDIKVTSARQPQSSCPFKDARQKIFGLGYNLLVFVYEKSDRPDTAQVTLDFVSCAFVAKNRTGDYTTSFRLREMLKDGANEADIIAYLSDKNIPADEITLSQLARHILANPPEQGYLSISNALQWRLQYQRIVALDAPIQGITPIVRRRPE